tara:strand:- start:3687 stop:4637 length:951 start_codon:yes stop_codon:yes gene_type:complete
MVYENSQKFSTKFYCEKCDYYANRKSDLNKHFNSKKHNDTLKFSNDTPKFSINCECGKVYKFHSGFYRHKKICKYVSSNCIISLDNSNNNNNSSNINNINQDENTSYLKDDEYKSMFLKLLDENKEFKNMLIKQQNQIGELIPKVGNNNVNNVNNVNQKFNVNIFLNTHCKDALNIDEFVKNIDINLDDLDYTKNNGLAEGISNAIIQNMSKLSLYERPLHCTDVKRETLYIKNQDAWEKDDYKIKIKKAIKDVSDKQFKSIKKWTNTNPDFQDDTNKQEYFAKVLSVLGKDNKEVDTKVIKKICNNYNLKNLIKD